MINSLKKICSFLFYFVVFFCYFVPFFPVLLIFRIYVTISMFCYSLPHKLFLFTPFRKHASSTFRILWSPRLRPRHQELLRKQTQIRLWIIPKHLVPIRFSCLVVCFDCWNCRFNHWSYHVDYPLCYRSLRHQVSILLTNLFSTTLNHYFLSGNYNI